MRESISSHLYSCLVIFVMLKTVEQFRVVPRSSVEVVRPKRVVSLDSTRSFLATYFNNQTSGIYLLGVFRRTQKYFTLSNTVRGK